MGATLFVLWQTCIPWPLQAIRAQQLELERGTEGFFRKVQSMSTPNPRVWTRALRTAWEPGLAQYCFPKWQCDGTRSYPLTYSAWVWQQPNCGAVTENMRPAQPTVFTLWLTAGKVYMLLLRAVVRQIRKGRVESLKVGLLVNVINYVSLSSVPLSLFLYLRQGLIQ